MSEEPQGQGWPPRDATVSAPAAQTPSGGARSPGQGRRGWRRFVPGWRLVLGALVLIALLLTGGFLAGYALVHIPSANATATAQSNVYLYEDGTLLARDGEVNRESVPLGQVPLTVRQAVLAAEDRDFYSQRAVDPKAMVRAAWNTLTGKGKQSGSTITQQYVKNYYLGQEQTLSRKWKEFFISIKLSREQSKDEILQGYLNTSYFGRNAYGVQAAAQAYYGKDIEEIDTAEGAYLATLLNAPSTFDVTTHPENRNAALARWNYTLGGMVKEKWLTPSERAAMTFPDPQRARSATGLSGQRGYVVQAVEEYLTGDAEGTVILDEKTLAAGGYRITTTLERAKQDAFTEAVTDQVTSRLDGERKADRNVRVGGASIDPATGRVVAMYGGVDYTRQYVNNATRRDYQVGSAFKPFVFASAVENHSRTQDGGRITPETLYDGTDRRRVEGWSGSRYAPENEDGISYGRITVTEATDKSVNAVYAQMAMDVGPATVRKTAIGLGIPADTPDLSASPSIALGPATPSVLDMAEAYATLADHGRHRAYTLVTKVTKDGVAVRLPKRAARQAVSREAADTTTGILQSVVDGGTGTAAQSAGRPAAGKTGTAEEDRAAWFAGYTPELATVVAVMGQDPDTGTQKSLYGAMGVARVNGGGAPARIWGQFTGLALADREIVEFELLLEPGAWQERSPTASSSPSEPGRGSGSPGRAPSRAPSRGPSVSGGPGETKAPESPPLPEAPPTVGEAPQEAEAGPVTEGVGRPETGEGAPFGGGSDGGAGDGGAPGEEAGPAGPAGPADPAGRPDPGAMTGPR
ncbi:transglycosylase domain-containing protein [Streptomyces katsurahamanus]|uniref:Penicillin-binding protein n=1 Tax=Streptomyces katsurahamanus TaxID=2577098 RepID=A0ABW9NXE8_9ACTN|nr:transglycosylase domain-containing protein [Streptomyces katsurahamanus]MQS37938.1 penicillin-binding protein [Streptomyces katsurahamanus]